MNLRGLHKSECYEGFAIFQDVSWSVHAINTLEEPFQKYGNSFISQTLRPLLVHVLEDVKNRMPILLRNMKLEQEQKIVNLQSKYFH